MRPPDPALVCGPDLELLVSGFAGYGRVAHLRRSLLSAPQVIAARVVAYERQVVRMTVTVHPGTVVASLLLPGTRLVAAEPGRVELLAELGPP